MYWKPKSLHFSLANLSCLSTKLTVDERLQSDSIKGDTISISHDHRDRKHQPICYAQSECILYKIEMKSYDHVSNTHFQIHGVIWFGKLSNGFDSSFNASYRNK